MAATGAELERAKAHGRASAKVGQQGMLGAKQEEQSCSSASITPISKQSGGTVGVGSWPGRCACSLFCQVDCPPARQLADGRVRVLLVPASKQPTGPHGAFRGAVAKGSWSTRAAWLSRSSKCIARQAGEYCQPCSQPETVHAPSLQRTHFPRCLASRQKPQALVGCAMLALLQGGTGRVGWGPDSAVCAHFSQMMAENMPASPPLSIASDWQHRSRPCNFAPVMLPKRDK